MRIYIVGDIFFLMFDVVKWVRKKEKEWLILKSFGNIGLLDKIE